MSDIYSMFRKFINDDVTDYSMPDLETLKFLDSGILKLSEFADKRIYEDITITSTDIANGYKDLTHDCLSLIYTDMPYEGVYWQLDGLRRIVFWDTDYITEGTFDFKYKTTYKMFDGALRDNAYFDYPDSSSLDLGIVFWALAQYQSVNGIIAPDGSRNATISKSEEGLSVSYSSAETLDMSSPSALKERAIELFQGLNNKSKYIFSITV